MFPDVITDRKNAVRWFLVHQRLPVLSHSLQEHRICIENGKKVDDVIDLSIEHFNKVMQTFKPSVTPKDILQYMIFEENRSSK